MTFFIVNGICGTLFIIFALLGAAAAYYLSEEKTKLFKRFAIAALVVFFMWMWVLNLLFSGVLYGRR